MIFLEILLFFSRHCLWQSGYAIYNSEFPPDTTSNVMRMKGGQTHSDSGWTNLNLKWEFTLRCSKCAFAFGMFILSLSVSFASLCSETATKDKKTNVAMNAFLEDSFHLSLFITNNFGSASSASLTPVFISLSHLILYFSLSLFPYTQSPNFVNLHHLEIQGAGNYAYSFRSLKNFEHICPTLIPNVFSYFISLRPLTAAHECLFLFHRVLSDIHNVISTTHISFFYSIISLKEKCRKSTLFICLLNIMMYLKWMVCFYILGGNNLLCSSAGKSEHFWCLGYYVIPYIIVKLYLWCWPKCAKEIALALKSWKLLIEQLRANFQNPIKSDLLLWYDQTYHVSHYFHVNIHQVPQHRLVNKQYLISATWDHHV